MAKKIQKSSTKGIPQDAKIRAKSAYDLLGQLLLNVDPSRLSEYSPTQSIPNHGLIEYGLKLHPYTYEGGATDEEAYDRLFTGVQNRAIPNWDLLNIQLHVPNEQCMIFWSARWVDQGCPRVVFDNNYASLLMATDVGKDLTDKIVFPWKAFLIELAEGILFLTDGEGKPSPVQKIFVHAVNLENGEEKFNIVAMARNGLQLWRHGSRINELTVSKTARDRVWDIGFKTDSRDDRVLNLIGRLIISMCVAMSDPDNFRKQKLNRKSKKKHRVTKRTATTLPEIQTFVIGKPTKLNCRPALTDYIEGTRRGPTVRFLVRGHWKLQAYGPGWTKRKLIQIEPYWKGPEEAKILTRTVLMGEQE